MYRSYLLKNNFWAKKGNEQDPNAEKIYIKHDEVGGIYAIILNKERTGVKIIFEGEERFFNNFDKLDLYLNSLKERQDDFIRILKRKTVSKRLRQLDI